MGHSIRSDFVSTPFWEEYVNKSKKSSPTMAFVWLSIIALLAGALLYMGHDWFIGLPVTHVDYAKELELTLMWGTILLGLGATILVFLALFWLCDYLEPAYKELFEGENYRYKAIDQD